MVARTPGLSEADVLWWGPTIHALFFALTCAAAAVFLKLVAAVPRRRWTARSFAICYAVAVFVAIAVLGRWRFQAEFLGGAVPSVAGKLAVWGVTLIIASTAAGIALWLASRFERTVLVASALLYAAGWIAAAIHGESAAATPAHVRPADPRRPHVVLIVADTLRADFTSAYDSSSPAKTPSLTELARDSILFEESYAQSSWTKPSFATILSGLYPRSHTATKAFTALPGRVTTLAELLGSNGYFTKGMSNANPNNSDRMNFSQGFMSWEDIETDHYLLGAPRSATHLISYKRILMRAAASLGVSDDVRNYYQPAEVITDRTLDWLDSETRTEDAGLFLLVHYMDPHSPYMSGRVRGRALRPHLLPDTPDKREILIDAYARDVSYMDLHIGRLLEGLKDRGLYDDALVIFTSDHGEEFHEHGGWEHYNTLYDELIAVPLIIKLPRSVGRGSRCSDMATHIDLAPTILRWAGIDGEGRELPGRVLADSNGLVACQDPEELYCFSETSSPGHAESIRTPDAKLIRTVEDTGRGQEPLELYSLRDDPGEKKNLASGGDALVSVLSRLLDEVIAEATRLSVDAVTRPGMTEEAKRQLRALGYVK